MDRLRWGRWLWVVASTGLLIAVVGIWLIASPETAGDRISLLQIYAGLFVGVTVAIGSYIAWENLKVNREGQITERFTRAIDQLGASDNDGNPKIEIRLGGIYALERIANDSDRDYQVIMETITAYVRQNSPALSTDGSIVESPISEDVAAIIEVIRRRRSGLESGFFTGWTCLGATSPVLGSTRLTSPEPRSTGLT